MQTHIQQIAVMLRANDGGHYSGCPYTTILRDYVIDVSAVLAIPDCYIFDDDESYCPTSEIPDEVSARFALRPVQYVGDKVYVLGDNGQCMFMVRGTRQTN